jgi:hypothetical protein
MHPNSHILEALGRQRAAELYRQAAACDLAAECHRWRVADAATARPRCAAKCDPAFVRIGGEKR